MDTKQQTPRHRGSGHERSSCRWSLVLVALASTIALSCSSSSQTTEPVANPGSPSDQDQTETDIEFTDGIIPSVVETNVESCGGMGDVFQLDAPGSYAAFAMRSSGSLLTEVRGSQGVLLATSHPTMATAGAVDLPSGLRFGVAAPQVFEVQSRVTIHVHHDDSRYELVLVRVDGTGEFSRLHVRPPVERVVDESASCRTGDSCDTFKIHTEAVYSDTGARQVFLIDSPNRGSIAEARWRRSTDQQRGSTKAWPVVIAAYSLRTSGFIAIR